MQLTEEQRETLRLALGYIGSSDRSDRMIHVERLRALLAAHNTGLTMEVANGLEQLISAWTVTANAEQAKRRVDTIGVAAGIRGCIRGVQLLLAAHNAGAQEPVAWLTPGNDLYLENPGYDDWTPLYTHPQPITDAARDVLETAAVWLHAAYDRPPQYPECKAMLRRIDAEIERLDRAKGE